MVNYYLGRLGVARSEIGFPFLFQEVPYVPGLPGAGRGGGVRGPAAVRLVPGPFPADVEAAVAVTGPPGQGLRHYNVSISHLGPGNRGQIPRQA